MLYHSLDKFKQEAMQLNKALMKSLPDTQTTLTTCQNIIASSLNGIDSFNALYLAHKRQLKEHVHKFKSQVLADSQEPLLDEWFEFASPIAQQRWLNARYEALSQSIAKHFSKTAWDRVEPAIKAMWTSKLYNHRLLEQLSLSNTTSFSSLSEKEWRSGILLQGLGEKEYLAFIGKCLPKLKRDGGVLILSPEQAKDAVNMWEEHPDNARAPLCVFNLVNAIEWRPCDAIQPHTYWPALNTSCGKVSATVDNFLLTTFHRSMYMESFCHRDMIGEGGEMWSGRALSFIDSYAIACKDHSSVGLLPDIKRLLTLVQDESIPHHLKNGIVEVLTSLNVPSYTSPDHARNLPKSVIEQFGYACPRTAKITDSFTFHSRAASRITLGEWVSKPRLSIFIMPESSPPREDLWPLAAWGQKNAALMLSGMLSVLCGSEACLALSDHTKGLGKGLYVAPSPEVQKRCEKGLAEPPKPLRNHTLWGWVRFTKDDLSGTAAPLSESANSVRENEGVSISVSPQEPEHMIIRHRIGSFDHKNDQYLSWSKAVMGNIT
jgi:hypothetical protein